MNIKYFIGHPKNILLALIYKYGGFLKDSVYAKLLYRIKLGRKLHLDNPRTYTEKIQWLKLYNRDPLYTQLVDKVEVKRIVADKIGDKYVIPTIGIWDKPEDIEWEKLPSQFVLKTTHGGGNYGVIVCKDKGAINIDEICRKLDLSLKQDLYRTLREWPYKDVKKRIMAEQYLEDESGFELKDYKIFCFNGVPKMIDVDYNRATNHQRNLYTPDWVRINATLGYPSDETREIPRPNVLEELLGLAKELSSGFPHVRTDFYIIGDKIYFGELTFYHGSGFEKSYPDDFDWEMGKWLSLPTKKC